MHEYLGGAIAFAASFVAGLINAVAGGGTLVTFPTLIWLGLNSVTANATSTVALWPGALGSILGYRRELLATERRMLYLAIPSLLGGLGGALLLRRTPTDVFDRLVPFLLLFATLLFTAQEPVQRLLRNVHAGSHWPKGWIAGAILFQFLVGIYGGYFGAGIGILMLAALSLMGMKDIHQMNGLKITLGGSINAVAALYFIAHEMVSWPHVGLMAAGSICGGYFGADAARWAGRTAVRRIVIAIGFAMALAFLVGE